MHRITLILFAVVLWFVPGFVKAQTSLGSTSSAQIGPNYIAFGQSPTGGPYVPYPGYGRFSVSAPVSGVFSAAGIAAGSTGQIQSLDESITQVGVQYTPALGTSRPFIAFAESNLLLYATDLVPGSTSGPLTLTGAPFGTLISFEIHGIVWDPSTNAQQDFALVCSATFPGISPTDLVASLPAITAISCTIAVTGTETPGPAAASPVFFGPAGTPVNPTAFFAEPVNTATGDYYSTHTDLRVRGRGLDFVLRRSYNSLDTSTGPLGPGWTHSYLLSLTVDPSTSVATLKEASGSVQSFSPTGLGMYSNLTVGSHDRLTRNPDGSFTLTRKNRTKLNFSTTGNLLSIVDRNGNTQTISYDPFGNVISVTDTLGRVFTFAYDGNSHLVSVSDFSGRKVQYGYDDGGNLVSFTDAAGGITAYTYDSSHRLLSAIDPRGITYVQNTYDTNGRVVAQKDGRGSVTQFSYDTPSQGTTTITDGNGNTIRYVYDGNLRLVMVINGVGAATAYSYDDNNNKTAITNANGNAETLMYDINGNPLTVTNAAEQTATFTYDSFNDVTSITDPLGHTMSFSYDGNGNLIGIQDALAAKTAYSYDGFGEMVTSTDALGNTVRLSWDSLGNLSQMTDGSGRTYHFDYDALGRVMSLTDGLGHTRKMQYDTLGRALSSTDPLGNQTHYGYDSVGELVKITDANGNSMMYTYDAAYKLITVADALDEKTNYSYDANGNRVSFTNANGKSTSYAYDGANRCIKVVDPLGRSKLFSYDPVGNMLTITDGNEHTNRFTYDAANRRLTTTYADGSSVSFSYDANGNRTAMSDSLGTTSYDYDPLNRLTSVTRFDGKTVAYFYSSVGRRTSMVYPDGHAVHYQYDGAYKLTAVTDWTGGETTYSYDQAGNLILAKLPNGLVLKYGYDAANRLLSIVNIGRMGVLSDFVYTLDNVGNRLTVSENAGVSAYGYDALNRLISWQSPLRATVQYAYDADGNRTSVRLLGGGVVSFVYDDADELLRAGPTTFTYDGNGSRITATGLGITTSYKWDSANRLTAVSSALNSVQYVYDGDGNRVAQNTTFGNYAYVNDIIDLPVVISQESSAGSTDYVYGRDMISAAGANGASYLDYDGLGSVANISGSNGAVKGNYFYDPWGLVLPVIDRLGFEVPYKFAGQALDAAAGLYYMRARYYDPLTATFLSQDLFASSWVPMSRNPYLYARANPIRLSDPTGFSAEPTGNTDAGHRSLALALVAGVDPLAVWPTVIGIPGPLPGPTSVTITPIAIIVDCDPNNPRSWCSGGGPSQPPNVKVSTATAVGYNGEHRNVSVGPSVP